MKRKCPKCSRDAQKVLYGEACISDRSCGAGGLACHEPEEHLHLACQCGYMWTMPCDDAPAAGGIKCDGGRTDKPSDCPRPVAYQCICEKCLTFGTDLKERFYACVECIADGTAGARHRRIRPERFQPTWVPFDLDGEGITELVSKLATSQHEQISQLRRDYQRTLESELKSLEALLCVPEEKWTVDGLMTHMRSWHKAVQRQLIELERWIPAMPKDGL